MALRYALLLSYSIPLLQFSNIGLFNEKLPEEGICYRPDRRESRAK